MRVSALSLRFISFAFALHLATASSGHVNAKWSEGEHLELGDTAPLLACAELAIDVADCPTTGIPREDRKVIFSYGELLSAADYYLSPFELIGDRRRGVRKVIQCAHRLKQEHSDRSLDSEKYKDCTFVGVFRMPGHLEVVSRNYDHFVWHNMKAYVRYHSLALTYAYEAYLKSGTNPAESRMALERALIFNAFADHYLTDAFAAGHVRLPRVQIETWAKHNLKGALKKTRGDLLAIILHDNEARDLWTGHEVGLPVKNARGDIWRTHSDQYLHAGAKYTTPAFHFPLQAIKESFKELLVAWKTGKLPQGIYRAAMYVPFHQDTALQEKFGPAKQGRSGDDIVRALNDTLPVYLRMVTSKKDLQSLLTALPTIFAAFRSDLLLDLSTDPELKRRLPREYLEALSSID